MIEKILNFILSKLPLDGYKTIIGAVFLALAAGSAGLADVISLFPQNETLATVQHYLVVILDFVEHYGESIGIPVVYLGLIHKYIKMKKDSYF